MDENFSLQIITPDEKIFSSEVIEVSIPSFEGQMTILKDHIPIITFLRPGFVEIKEKKENIKLYIEEGTVEFLKNKMLILTTYIKNLKDFNNVKISEMIKQLENKIEDTSLSDKQKYILSYKISSLKEINQ